MSEFNRNKCRDAGNESFHVSYSVVEIDDHPGEVEKHNWTHRDEPCFEDRDDEPVNWMAQIAEQGDCKAQMLLTVGAEPMGWDLEHFISAQTCRQLSDMFARAADVLERNEAAKKAEDERVQSVIDSQNLPFVEKIG